MKTALFLTVAALLLVGAAARCPNSCSGHGNCGPSDKCSCWANWQGPDCSLRTCAFDIAWATDHWSDAHYYAECSGKGLCDRETGECVCFEGYTGRACKRSVCPNDCSGHGKCRLVEELPAASMYRTQAYTDWDGDKIQACVCDGGFYGPDCSQRFCPKGDDPMTICKNTANDTDQVQLLTIAFNLNEDDDGDDTTFVEAGTDELVLKFTDNHNETWYTQRITNVFDNTTTNDYAGGLVYADGTGASNIKNALESIPNFKIPSVDVGLPHYGRQGVVQYLITFNSERNSGNQSLLTCDQPLGCMTEGCQPKYRQPRVIKTAGSNCPTITTDSVLDGIFPDAAGAVGLVHDVSIAIVVTATPGGTANTYTATFTVNDGASPTTEPTINHGRIPIGAASTGVGYDHAELGHGLYAAFTSEEHAATSDCVISYSVPRCSVVEVIAANNEKEDIECSGRGACDSEAGTCTCFEGYYGDHCNLQTILV